MIGEGVQGVTEGFKLRVVMPLTGSYADTDHVLGHELIHQFQYDISQRAGNFANFVRLPLWIVEGMAEYFSSGATTPTRRCGCATPPSATPSPPSSSSRATPATSPTATGRPSGRGSAAPTATRPPCSSSAPPRDAARQRHRLGHRPLVRLALGALGAGGGRDVPPGIRGKQAPPVPGRDLAGTRPRAGSTPSASTPLAGRRVLARDIDAGDLNVSPQVSPDGRYVAFLSERDLFGIDLFLADAQTGR
jgi:hypothetical protein